MLVFSRKSFKIFINICCLLTVAFMIGYWLYKYEIEDRDIGEVDYVTFKEAAKVHYPTLSICFENPIICKRIMCITTKCLQDSF